MRTLDNHRTPPANIEAEESVLGAMLLSDSSISDVLEKLRPDDFYRPAHRKIFEAVIGLFGRGEAVDPVTVSEELRRAGDLEDIGGKSTIFHLVNSVPAASNAFHYARIVEETSLLRRLIEATQEAAAMAYDSGDDVDRIVDHVEQLIFSVAERRLGDRFTHIRDLLHEHLEQVEALQLRGSAITGVPTGFVDLDKLTSGFQPSNLIIVAARPSFGKALALDTPLVTPAGWTTMGEVQVGDEILGPDGRPARVTGVTDVMYGHPCYEVEFSDGEVIVADAEHLWVTTTRAARKAAAERRPPAYYWPEDDMARVVRLAAEAGSEPDRLVGTTELLQDVGDVFRNVLRGWVIKQVPSAGREPRPAVRSGRSYLFPVPVYSRQLLLKVLAERVTRPVGSSSAREHADVVTTAEIASTLWHGTGRHRRYNHAVANSRPLQLPEQQLPLSPYLLGVWLGSGTGYRGSTVGAVQAVVRNLGVLGDKHIPAEYLRASERQRRELLAGLLDTDGTVAPTGSVQFTSTNLRLAREVRELVVSLGYRCYHNERRVNGRSEATSIAYTVGFFTSDDVFRLSPKRSAHRERRGRRPSRTASRSIVAVRPVASVPVRCIQVDNEMHQYLASRSMIPTHNTSFALNVAQQAATEHNVPVAIFSLEMSKMELVQRLVCAEALVDVHRLRTGNLNDNDWSRLANAVGRLADAPVYIDDTEAVTVLEIRAKARRLKQRAGLGLVIVDYLQLMQGPRRSENRQQEISEISRSLKILARELDLPVIAVSQLSRNVEYRSDKRPMLADLRESGSIEQDSDVVMFIYRDEVYNPDSTDKGTAEVLVAKHRNGPTGTIKLTFLQNYTKFANYSGA